MEPFSTEELEEDEAYFKFQSQTQHQQKEESDPAKSQIQIRKQQILNKNLTQHEDQNQIRNFSALHIPTGNIDPDLRVTDLHTTATDEDEGKYTLEDLSSFPAVTSLTASSFVAKPRGKPPPDTHRESAGVEGPKGRALAIVNNGHDGTMVNSPLKTKNGVEHIVFNASSNGIDTSSTGEHRRCALRLVARPPKLLAAAFPWNRDDENQSRKNQVCVEVTGIPLLAVETITAVMRVLTEEKVGAWDEEVTARKGGKMEGVAAVMFHFRKKRQKVCLLGCHLFIIRELGFLSLGLTHCIKKKKKRFWLGFFSLNQFNLLFLLIQSNFGIQEEF